MTGRKKINKSREFYGVNVYVGMDVSVSCSDVFIDGELCKIDSVVFNGIVSIDFEPCRIHMKIVHDDEGSLVDMELYDGNDLDMLIDKVDILEYRNEVKEFIVKTTGFDFFS